jgi:predicted glycoside hydrolase/deacetylase ChbG (UPF0249 family)
MFKLFINADDFGLCEPVNDAILDLAQLGALQSTTVMVNMPYAEAARELLAVDGFQVGLHVTLTEGRPVAAVDKVASLVDAEGRFFDSVVFRKRLKARKIQEAEIDFEIEAQWQRLCGILGRAPSHIDSHQNVHKQRSVLQAFLRFGHRHPDCGVRNPNRYVFDTKTKNAKLMPSWSYSLRSANMRQFFTDLYLRNAGRQLKKVFHAPDGELHAANFKKLELLEAIQAGRFSTASGSGYVEVACHPATTTEGLGSDKLGEKRVQEYHCMRDPQFAKNLVKPKAVF